MLNLASKYWRLRPAPRDKPARGFQAIAGLTLTDFTTESIAWYRPIQSDGYSVFKPKGALIPMPALTPGVTSVA